jgi:hypothetical protein
MIGVFIHLGNGRRGLILHVTTLLCEVAILTVTIKVLKGQLTLPGSHFHSETAYLVMSGLSTFVGFVLSVLGIRKILQVARRIVATTQTATGAARPGLP